MNDGRTYYKIDGRSRKWPLDETVFRRAESCPRAAYWIGLLMADGSVGISKSGQHTVKLALAESDMKHVHSFAKFLRTEAPVKTVSNSRGFPGSRPLSELYVTSRPLVEALSRYGIVPHKSKGASVKLIQNSRDFWRGMIDGDGWMRGGKVPYLGLTGCLSLIEQFQQFVTPIIGKCPPIRPNNSIWKIEVVCSQAAVIARVLYERCDEALERKFVVANEVMKWNRTLPDYQHHTLESLLELRRSTSTWGEVADGLGMKHNVLACLLCRLRKRQTAGGGLRQS